MNRRSWIAPALTAIVASATLAGCAVYPGGPYGYRGDHGYGRHHGYASSAPGWRGREGGWRGERYADGWGRRDGWR
ncbi:hypothetical protein [Muricoccus radiodurans]|uniref:hypothetical protein n=1 Tax=Muricoccus radiodurans TaxID=2231721 RepID=UPI003CF6C157